MPREDSEILHRSLQLMQRRGRARGDFTGPRGEVCIEGAIGAVAANDPYDNRHPEARSAIMTMYRSGATGRRPPHRFNDATRDDRVVHDAMMEATEYARDREVETRLGPGYITERSTDELVEAAQDPLISDHYRSELLEELGRNGVEDEDGEYHRGGGNPLGVPTGPMRGGGF